jgi:hypothetical protein
MRHTIDVVLLCVQDSGKRTLCLDANFGLVRKKNAGKGVDDSAGASSFFVNDAVVDKFVESYGASYTKKSVRM